MTKKPNSALRYNEGKPRFDLIPPEFEIALAEHFTRNMEKYPGRNWEAGMNWGKCYSSLRDHLTAFWAGQDYDPENGAHHMIAAAWNAMALYCYSVRQAGVDDRPFPNGDLPGNDPIDLICKALLQDQLVKEHDSGIIDTGDTVLIPERLVPRTVKHLSDSGT